MALPGSGVVNAGLQQIGINASQVGGSGAVGSSQTVTKYMMTVSVDDNANNFAAADTALNTSRGTVTNVFAQLLDAFATRTNQTISHVVTIGTGNGNFTIKGIALHNLTAASVTASSTSLMAGIAGQSLAKTSSFSLAITLNLLYTDNS